MENKNDWIDVSVPFHDGMAHWPGQPEVSITLFESIASGGVANVSMLQMMAHNGTHMDAPLHFIKNGKNITEVPLDILMGVVSVLEIRNTTVIELSHIIKYTINEGDKLLFRTDNSDTDWTRKEFKNDFVHLSVEAAKYLAEKKVSLIGVDYLSIGSLENGIEVHRAILGAGIWVIEGLNLRDINKGEYEMICLPIKIEGADGAPARALLRELKK